VARRTGIRAKQRGTGCPGRWICVLTLRNFVVFAQFDDFVNVFTPKSFQNDDRVALR
jgi:hypothetical protein